MMHEEIVPLPVLVADLVPDECAGILTGAGGGGKGILMQSLATCVASPDKPFLGRLTQHGRAAFITAEDTRRILINRQDKISRELGIAPEDLADSLILKSVTNEDMFLFRQGKRTGLAIAFEAWLAGLEQLRLAVIDSAALVFDDSEIDRRLVAAFLRYLNRLAARLKCTIILITHPSRSSDDSVERMTSGSTSWIFGARFGLVLKRDEKSNETTLELRKANYMKPGLKIGLEWTDEGVLVGLEEDTGMVADLQGNKDDDFVLAEVTARWNHPDAEPLSKAANVGDRYLPRFMSRQHGWKAKRAEAALSRLLDAIKVTTGEAKKHGKRLSGLRPVA